MDTQTTVTDVTQLTVVDCRQLIAGKQLSPTELVAALLSRIERLDPQLHAFVTVVGDAAMADAKTAEEQVMRGDPLGPLHGVPFAVKDVICTAGVRTTAQSRQLEGFVPERSAAAVVRLRRAGGILLGKLTTHEFALGGPDFDLPWPPARNPWDVRRFAGGSSSGSAVAVAAGMVPAALGTDTGGSIRNPASLCGVVGLKPTYGAVSRRGMIPLAFSTDHVGPMSRTVSDTELLLGVLRGTAGDYGDGAGVLERVPVALAESNVLDGVRVGVVRHFYDADQKAEPDVIAALDKASGVLGALGAEVDEVRIDSLGDYQECGRLILSVESHVAHRGMLAASPELFAPRSRARLEAGATISGPDYQRALEQRQTFKSRLADVFSRYDVLVTATALEVAPTLDDVPALENHAARNATLPFSVTGFPAMVVPVGLSDLGLPIGMQIVARPFDESAAFRVGRAYDSTAPILRPALSGRPGDEVPGWAPSQ